MIFTIPLAQCSVGAKLNNFSLLFVKFVFWECMMLCQLTIDTISARTSFNMHVPIKFNRNHVDNAMSCAWKARTS